MTVFVLAVTTALVVSFACSIFEAVLLSLGLVQVETMKESGSLAGRILARFRKDPDVPIAAILILNTLAHTVGAFVAGTTYNEVFDESTAWIFSLVFTLAVLIFTEIIPKTLGVTFSRTLAGPVAIMVQGLVIGLKPVLVLTRAMTKLLRPKEEAPITSVDEIRLLASLGRDQGVLREKTANIIEGAGLLRDLTAEDAMMPRQRVAYLSADRTLEENLAVIRETGHSRFPFTTEAELDRVTGIVLAKDVLFNVLDGSEPDWESLLRPAVFVPETARLHNVLLTFQKERRHLAIVIDEYGGASGVITLEDVLEEIVGEIWDETDRAETGIAQRADGGWVARGEVEVRAAFRVLGLDLKEESVSDAVTLSGFLTKKLGSVPQSGNVIEYGSFRFHVSAATPRRAERIEIDRLPEEGTEEAQ